MLLARPAQDVNLLDVIELLEGPISLTECLVDLRDCSISGDCLLKDRMETAQERMRDVFRSTTIKDLLQRKGAQV